MNEIQSLRTIIFLGLIILFHVWQLLRPAFPNAIHKRQLTNWMIFFTSIFVMKLAFPTGIAGALTYFQSNNLDLISLHKLPLGIEIVVTVLIFDMAIYWQHRIMHIFGPLWRLHEVHHCDREMDLSTGFRFHPLEILVSAAYKALLVLILSPRVEVFVLYEIILNSMAIFNHSNIAINRNVDRFLRLFIVTPDMHFPHHSVQGRLMHMNYGNFLSIWDRIFNSYTDEPIDRFGVETIPSDNASDYLSQLKQPFQKH
jgi:sterol desaturase/sphingolipid hydroxylase (fatty acid hydroxylase superfamily)